MSFGKLDAFCKQLKKKPHGLQLPFWLLGFGFRDRTIGSHRTYTWFNFSQNLLDASNFSMFEQDVGNEEAR